MAEVERSVRDLISHYVADLITLEALGRGLPDGWELDRVDEPEIKRLVLLIIGYLSEYERDNLTEAEIRRRLSPEASWHLVRTSTSVNPTPRPEQVFTQVRADADTELQEVLVS